MSFSNLPTDLQASTAPFNATSTDCDTNSAKVQGDGILSPSGVQRPNCTLKVQTEEDSGPSSLAELDTTRCNSELGLDSWSVVDSRSIAVDDIGANVTGEKLQVKPKKIISETEIHRDVGGSAWVTVLRGRWLDFCTWFTPYRQIFFLVAGTNGALVVAILAGALGGASQDLSVMVVVNVLIAIAIRNEWVIRFLYWIAIKCFRSARIPVRIRKTMVGMLYHIGA